MKLTIKKTLSVLLLAAGIGASLNSCKKDSATSNDTITEADAAEAATDAVVPSTAGFTTQMSSSVTTYKTVTLACGVSKDSSIVKSSVTGVVPAYSYSLKWSYMLNCTLNQFTGSFSGSSSYNGLRMSSADNSTGSIVLTGILPTAATYTINTTYTRNGSQTSKIGNNNSFTSTINITSSNIMVDKTSLAILSGNATVAITGSSTSGKSFAFNGTITFLGSNKATLLLNSGVTYNITW